MPTKKYALPEEQQVKLIDMLNRRLADAIDLQLQSRQAYWNVKGPNFMALRELFDKVVQGVEEYANLIAERIVQLGGKARERRTRSPGGLRSTGIGFRVPMGMATSMRFRRPSPTLADMPAMPARRETSPRRVGLPRS